MDIDRPVSTHLVPPRTGHVSVCFTKYMIVWGGYANYNYLHEVYLPPDEIWLYNTDVGYWMKKATTGQYPSGTSGASACLYDNQMYVFAGHTKNGNVNALYRLDLRTLHWELVEVSPTSDLPSPRDKCVCWAYQNRLYYFGGFCVPLKGYLYENGEFHEDDSIVGLRGWNNQLVVFDLETNTWSNPRCKGYVPTTRAAHAAVRVGHVVYIFGGRHIQDRINDLYRLDLDTLNWTGPLMAGGGSPSGRSWHTFTQVTERLLFLYGGFDQNDVPLNDAWLLDVDNLTWTMLVHYRHYNAHLWHTACCTREGEVVVFGGCTNNILSVEEPTKHSNEVLTFRIHPGSLLRICLDAVYKHRTKTRTQWNILPQSLSAWLQSKCEATNLASLEPPETIRDGQSVGATCTVA